jgi:holo-ACP synthase/triphosphoribosyl-dephospho-CoA synthase
MLDARELRAARQKALLKTYKGHCLICLTLNIPGPVKASTLYSRIHSEGMDCLNRLFTEDGLVMSQRLILPTGDEGYFCVTQDPIEVKKSAVGLEEGHPLGRLWDIDVLDGEGIPVSRQSLGGAPRRCFVCGEPAKICARSRRHPLHDLLESVERMGRAYFSRLDQAEGLARRLSQCASAALLFEVAATPKPGLVDMAGNGAHTDMNLLTFMASSAALAPHFERLAREGYEFAHLPPAVLFGRLRALGLEAEADMFRFTRGVNTHKGALFSLGLLCAAWGACAARTDSNHDFETVREMARQMTAGLCSRELETAPADASKGQQLFREYASPGIRLEAELGYPTVARHSLPLLRRLISEGRYALGPVLVYTLFALMAAAEDTNLLSRGGNEGLALVRGRAAALLEAHREPDPAFLEAAAAMDAEFVRLRLSPGGSADLLAVTFFIFLAESPDSFSLLRYI